MIDLPHDCQVAMGSYAAQVELVPPVHLRRSDGRGICVDSCLALEVSYLWRAGVVTTGCCCGHGVAPPYIGVTDATASLMVAFGYRPADNGDRLAFAPQSRCRP